MNDLILVGKQGSGKGTQAKMLSQQFGYVIFETGGALRAIAQEDSELGKKVKAITERGDLVPNEIVMDIVRDFVEKNDPSTPVIFDGIPRSEPQRASLEELLKEMGRDFQVLEITLSDDEAMSRLLKRAEIEGRADDKTDVILKRIENFKLHTIPLIEVWRGEGKLVEINGEQSMEGVYGEVIAKLSL